MSSIVLNPSGAPASPSEGEVYYDSTADKLKVRDASAFREIVTQDATFSGTVGSSATLPSKATDYTHFYHLRKNSTAMENYERYATSNNSENTYAYASGVAPTGFTTIVDMYEWFIAENGGTRTYQGQFAWNIGAHGQAANLHALSNTRYFEDLDLAQYDMARINLLSVGSSGSRFENLVENNDAFGLRVYHDVNAAVRPLGISITWRF